jgi:hypothetical protein
LDSSILQLVLTLLIAVAAVCDSRAEEKPFSRADGYRGCWYSIGKTDDEYKFKYSGGMGTYPQQHAPIAIYCKEVNKTFFVYGGSQPNSNSILHMISYYDHATGTVTKPTILLDKQTDDAHDNPTLAIDGKGFLWIFSNAHGTVRPAFVHRSQKPYSIDSFEKVWQTNFSYACPWILEDGQFLLLHTQYNQGRGLFSMTSQDGRNWSVPSAVAKIEAGDYQISWPHKGKVGTAFDFHPNGKGLDARTNLHYMESHNGAKLWHTASGDRIEIPLKSRNNTALIRDYAKDNKLVYIKDLNYNAEGRPVILYLTSQGHLPGKAQGPHTWHTARWDGKTWQFRDVSTSDHNYDHGSLYIEADGTWRIIAPFGPGPQPFGTGGEMQMWTSLDQGQTWAKLKDLTANSLRNHSYARRPLNAHPDFYAFWADGDARKRSASSLYFCNQDGSKVFRLPTQMTEESAKPELLK